MVVTLPATTKHVGELLSSTLAEDRKKNRLMLLRILGGRSTRCIFVGQLFSVRLMATSLNYSTCSLSMTNSLLVGLREKPTSILLLIYMQNEMLKVMSLRILGDIASKIKKQKHLPSWLMRQQMQVQKSSVF